MTSKAANEKCDDLTKRKCGPQYLGEPTLMALKSDMR